MEYNQKIVNRLKRSEGQLRGVLRMIEEASACHEVVTQLSAVRSSIDKAIGLIVAENLVSCIQDGHASKEEQIEKAIDLLLKSR